jgi:hypothetical protein
MSDLLLDVPNIIINTLKQDDDVMDALTVSYNGTDIFKVFDERAPEWLDPPYATINYYAGGRTRGIRNEASEPLFKVVVHGTDRAELKSIARYIFKALHHNDPVIPTALESSYAAFSWYSEVTPVMTPYFRQKSAWFEIGGIYKICLSHKE